jgi:hypothetical protein
MIQIIFNEVEILYLNKDKIEDHGTQKKQKI